MGNGTDFSGCDLSTTVFVANPKFGSNVANLTKFAGAKIPYKTLGTIWSYVDLTGATILGLPSDLTFLEVMESDLTGIDLSGRTLKNAHFYGVVLQKAKFTRGILDNIVFARGERVCDLTDANFAGAEVTEGVFDDSTLTRTDFTAASSLASASFLQTRMDGTRFDDCDVTTCRFSAPPRFSNDPANLTSFRGATLNYSTVAQPVVVPGPHGSQIGRAQPRRRLDLPRGGLCRSHRHGPERLHAGPVQFDRCHADRGTLQRRPHEPRATVRRAESG